MRRLQVQDRALGHDAGRIDHVVALVVVALDVPEIHRFGDAGHLVELAQETRQVRVVGDAAQVALEVAHVHRVEADERGEQPPVGFGQRVAAGVAGFRQAFFQPVESSEQWYYRIFIGLLGRRETGLVHAIVDVVVDAAVDLVDFRAPQFRVVVAGRRADAVEGAVEHADDVGRFVADHGGALAVPQHRHGDAPGIIRVGLQVQLVQATDAEDRVGHHAGPGFEGPALIAHQPVHHRHVDHLLQPLQAPEDQRAMRPGAGQRDIQVVTPGFGLEAAFAFRPGGAVGGDPVAELRLRALEATAALFGVVPGVLPLAVDQQSHGVLRLHLNQCPDHNAPGATGSVHG